MVKIKCKWKEINRYLVNPDGQVLPCCYVANKNYFDNVTNYNKENHNVTGRRYNNQEDARVSYIMGRYDKYAKELNIFENSIEDILKHKWWDELQESWKSDSQLDGRCRRFCGEDND